MKLIKDFIRVTALWMILLPYPVAILGIGLNQAVLIANHGKFPVMVNNHWPERIDGEGFFEGDTEHVVMSADSRLKFLADIITLSQGTDIVSIGDLLINASGIGQDYAIWIWAFYLATRLYSSQTTGSGDKKNESV